MKQDSKPATALSQREEGDACAARGEFDAALHRYEAALALDSSDPRSHERLAATLATLHRYPEAIDPYRAALRFEPDNADLHHGLGWALEQMHRLDEAVGAYRDAARLNPKADGSQNNIGNCLQALGRFDEAHEAYRLAIEAAPRVPLYYRNFVQTKRLAVDDPAFVAMERLVGEAHTLPPAAQVDIHFAYGQVLSDAGRHDASFDHFLKGNRLQRAQMHYDEAQSLGLFAQLPTLLDAGLLKAKANLGDPSAAPIFIVGMPRSGSTLIEQILASHPQVFGAGERTEFGAALVQSISREPGDPLKIAIDGLRDVRPAALAALGADYLQRIREALPHDTTHFTDKYPFNFMNVGLIHLALPNARFIHSRRSPLQTCLSIFSRIFHDVPFGYDLAELGRYYRAYDALMAHWQSVLPPGVMLEVRYEELVDDLEGHVRQMLGHCGLPWDDGCLAFHRTTRRVSTASSAQVRRPLYKSSLQRWQPSTELIQPLLDALGPVA
ncbi:tetratricopeptide repeat-containing sulfotransferase family protein [Paraburkholderia sp. BCC1886]|uniref:tetratricopeptide repeat-containing sulfotransferase family protein n=1 Tax=Paraburkholderia sp. BCC1886 TaxID=2562670 RepID=UPI00118467DF|nr:sulfotransferase [Paraburkholderia sp. BCC1886]